MPITDESSPDDPIVQSIRIWIENIDINNERSETEKIYAIYSVKSLYAQNEFKPFWNENHEIIEFIEEISQAYLEGLEPGDYHYYRLSELINLSQPTISQKAELDLLLTDSFLLYASHLLSGKVDPVTVDAEWHVVRREGNPVEIFSKTVKSNKFNESIDDIKPRNSQYNGLKTALKRYLDVEESGGWTMIVNGPVINTGMKDPRVAEVRKRLAITGDYSFPSSFLEDSIYDNSLAESVTRFQRRHGFKGDGKIDEPTIRMMNIPVEERINQIILNLERWRWMPSEFSNYFLLVNIANYNLDIYRQNKIEQSYKIIAGKPVRKTPVFSSRLSYLVFNPTWTVPLPF